MKHVILDQDHRNILKCFSGKRIKFHCWCDTHHGWKEMDYFNATRINRVRIDLSQQPNWWRVAEKGLHVLYNDYSYKLSGVNDIGTGLILYLLNEESDITISAQSTLCVIDFKREGLKVHEKDVETLG